MGAEEKMFRPLVGGLGVGLIGVGAYIYYQDTKEAAAGNRRFYQWGCMSVQGKRDHMEDRYTVGKLPSIALFGVFDGHGGSVTSTFASTYFNQYFVQNHNAHPDDMEKALRGAIAETQKQLQFAAPKKSPRDGSTAIICAVDQEAIWTVNVGDSRAVLSRNSKCIPLSEDHKPDRPDEKERIEAAGGQVLTNRDCPRIYNSNGQGGLALSRALGDEFYKNPKELLVPAEPDITRRELHRDDDFLILASDGLWDVYSSEKAVAFVNQLRKQQPLADANFISRELVRSALHLESTDNVTALVVLFKHANEDFIDGYELLSQPKQLSKM